MQLLEINYRIASEDRQCPDIWYSVAQVRLPLSVRRLLDIEEGTDDLGSLLYAYLETEGIAMSFQRYKSEPTQVFTLQIDAPSVVKKRKVGVISFVAATIASMKIKAESIVWLNERLNKEFPAPRLKDAQIDDFVRIVEMEVSEADFPSERNSYIDEMSMHIRDLQKVQKRAKDLPDMVKIIRAMKEKA